MTLSMSQALLPGAIRMLGNLARIREKAATQAEVHGFDASVLVNARLYPDMYPLARQVQISIDIASRGAARLAGQEPPSVPDTETTIPVEFPRPNSPKENRVDDIAQRV